MKSILGCLAAACLLCAPIISSAQAGYTLDVTTFYQFGNPPGVGPYAASPDTGFYTVTNNGSSTFMGTIGDLAVSNFAGDASFMSGLLTLAPSQSATFSVYYESSNVGGFNGPYGSPQPGVQILINGTVTDACGTSAVELSVYDRDIHSGVFRTNPYGDTLDNYVLQGGDALGRDTGDDYEVTQAPGHYRFFKASCTNVPEPSALATFGMGALGLFGFAWRRRKSA